MVDFTKKASILHAFNHARREAVAVPRKPAGVIRCIAKRRKAAPSGDALKRLKKRAGPIPAGHCDSPAHGRRESHHRIGTGSVHHQHPC
jgi:hypothetical protein